MIEQPDLPLETQVQQVCSAVPSPKPQGQALGFGLEDQLGKETQPTSVQTNLLDHDFVSLRTPSHSDPSISRRGTRKSFPRKP